MAPSLIIGYSKNLRQFPECTFRKKIRIGYLVAPDFSVLRLTEWVLEGSPEKYDYCLTATQVGGENNAWLQELALDRYADGNSESDIIRYIRSLGVEDEEADPHVARFVYKNFIFRSQAGIASGVQIKGAFVLPSKEQRALARTIYSFLLNWHQHVISDNHQTIYGAKIWANGMLQVGRVQIYNAIQMRFVDTLSSGGIGLHGLKPWDAMSLSEQQISSWNPNALSIDPADRILAVISAGDRRKPVGVTIYDRSRPKLRVSEYN